MVEIRWNMKGEIQRSWLCLENANAMQYPRRVIFPLHGVGHTPTLITEGATSIFDAFNSNNSHSKCNISKNVQKQFPNYSLLRITSRHQTFILLKFLMS